MTVYHSGGEFWTDQYETIDVSGDVCAFNYGNFLYTSPAQGAQAGAGGVVDVASNGGKFTCTDPGGALSRICGFVLDPPMAYPSGVPGTDTDFLGLPEGGNSIAWGTFLHVLLAL
jgi:hypothetical protein